MFFKDKGETEVYEITKHLNYEHFNKNDIIFEYGSQGDKYYLIIRGEVAVMLPSKKQQEVSRLYEEYNVD